MKVSLARDVALGIALFVVLFAIDLAESWYHIQTALKRVNADPEGTEILAQRVVVFMWGIAASYALMGVYAGMLHAAWQRLVLPQRRWVAGIATMVAFTLCGYARQVVLSPPLHDWFLLRPWFASNVPPEVPTAGMVAIVLGSVWVGWRRGAPQFPRRLGVVGVLLAAPFLLWRVPEPEEPRANAGVNVVLLSWDALRPDRLGFFGAERNVTPNLDRFLAESAVWDSAFTPLARTYPAWMSLLTGTFPMTNGIRDPLPPPERLVPRLRTFPQELASRGWFTSFLTDDSRFSYMVPEIGFQAIRQPTVGIAGHAISGSEPRFRAFYGLLDNPLGWLFVPVVRENQAFGRSYKPRWFNYRTSQAIADASEHDRFFLAIHDCTLHAPADRHHPYTNLFDQGAYKGSNRFRYLSLGSVSIADAQPEEAERLAAEQNLRIYDAGLVMVDEAFGKLRAQLEAGGLWENSIIVVMSDHGEDFYEPRQRYKFVGPNHGFHPWGTGQHRVLMAIRWPESMRDRFPSGIQENLVGLIDVVPTLAEALGFAWQGDGRSMYAPGNRTLYTETGVSEASYWPSGHRSYPFKSTAQYFTVDPETTRVHARREYRHAVLAGKDRFVMDEQFKLVWYAYGSGLHVDLFDWRADPLDDFDVKGEHPEVVVRLWRELRPRLLADGEGVPADILAALAAARAASAKGSPAPVTGPRADPPSARSLLLEGARSP